MSPIRLRVAELRAVRHWSQTELARRAKISRATVNRIEQDTNRRADFDTLEKLADVFEVDVGYLFQRVDKKRRKG